jgi:hypothetical protein
VNNLNILVLPWVSTVEGFRPNPNPNASLLPHLNVLDLILLEDHSCNAPRSHSTDFCLLRILSLGNAPFVTAQPKLNSILFLECPFAKIIWRNKKWPLDTSVFSGATMVHWIQINTCLSFAKTSLNSN